MTAIIVEPKKRDKRTIWWLSRVNEIYRWDYWPPFYPFSNNFYKPWQFTKVHYFLHRKDRRYLGESTLHGSVTANGFIMLLDWHQTNIWHNFICAHLYHIIFNFWILLYDYLFRLLVPSFIIFYYFYFLRSIVSNFFRKNCTCKAFLTTIFRGWSLNNKTWNIQQFLSYGTERNLITITGWNYNRTSSNFH